MTDDKEQMRRHYARLHANEVGFHLTDAELADLERWKSEWAQQPGEWIVARWSGRVTDIRRVAFKGPEAAARAKWQQLHLALRQGTVDLIAPDGSLVERSRAPR